MVVSKEQRGNETGKLRNKAGKRKGYPRDLSLVGVGRNYAKEKLEVIEWQVACSMLISPKGVNGA